MDARSHKFNFMKKRLFIYISIFVLTSCFGNNAYKTTDEENNAVKEIVNFYGGHCEFGTFIQVSSDGSKYYYYGLKLNGSPNFGNPETDNIFAAGIAYNFYSLLKNEKNKFDEIRTEIVDSNGRSKKYKYGIDELEIVKSEMPKVDLVIDLLKKRDYLGIINLSDTSLIIDKKIIVANLQRLEKEYGIMTAFRVSGFEFYKNEDGHTNLSICGQATSTIKNHVLKVVTDPKDRSMRFVLLNFKY